MGARLTAQSMGKKAESFILDWLSKRDKWTYVARFSDNYDANKGRWGKSKVVNVGKKPSDAVAIFSGITYFLEIKATTNVKGLTPSLFKTQEGERTRIINAGGHYAYLVYSIVRKRWYFIDAEILVPTDTWEDLETDRCWCESFPEVPGLLLN